MKNSYLTPIKSLTVGDRFRITGDARMATTIMFVEGIRTEAGRTLLRVRYENGGAQQQFHRPALTMVEIDATVNAE